MENRRNHMHIDILKLKFSIVEPQNCENTESVKRRSFQHFGLPIPISRT